MRETTEGKIYPYGVEHKSINRQLRVFEVAAYPKASRTWIYQKQRSKSDEFEIDGHKYV